MTSNVLDPGPGELDSEGCLFLVASYADVAPVVRAIAEKAESRIMMSPTLGDFIELHFVDLGPRPEQDIPAGGAQRAATVARITDAFIRPCDGAGRNYFALAVADRSATAAGQVLDDCAADPVIAELPLRRRGLASVDDREPAPESDLAAEMTISPTGSWRPDELVDELRRYGEQLLDDFAAGHERGLTPREIEALRSRIAQQPPDALHPQPPAERTDGATEQEQEPAQPVLPHHLEPEPGPSAPVQAPPRPLRHRWQRRRGSTPTAGGMVTGATGQPLLNGLVHLILTGDEYAPDRAAWRRGRSVLLELDKNLAAIPGIVYQVRLLQSPEDAEYGTLRPAGRLRSRNVKRPTTCQDFARTMDSLHVALKRDLTSLARSKSSLATKPLIVIFAADVPLADAITTRKYQELAKEASIIWLVPERSADLISPIFTESDDACIITDHAAVIEEVISLLGSTEDIEKAHTETR